MLYTGSCKTLIQKKHVFLMQFSVTKEYEKLQDFQFIKYITTTC